MAKTKITLDTNLNVDQNAQLYFEKAKKQRKKLEGAKKALTVSEKKREDLISRGEASLEKAKAYHAEKERQANIKKEWFENFRWFYSSEGFLVLGGRDATTNEIVIKKHTDKDDVVFHTDMAGSPFFVIKSGSHDGEPTEITLKEVADATLTFSRAWKMGLHTTPTFYVKPEQVTKDANAGESLAKGAFMIRGKTTYISTDPSCAIGPMKHIHKDKIMCAPLSAVKTHCENYVELIQGKTKPSALAKIIRRKFGGELDDIIRILPSGTLDIKK